MTLDLLYLLGGFLLSLYIGRMCIPRIILVSKRKRIFDEPDARKVHASPVSRLGGVSFFPAIMIAFTFFSGLMWLYSGGRFFAGGTVQESLFFCTGLIVIYAVGIWDDVTGMSWRFKLFFQFVAALLMVFAAPCLDNFQGLFGLHELPCWVACPFTVLLVVAVINAFNLIDGVDGLCSGLSMLIFLTLSIQFVRLGNYVWALLAACVLGIAAAFFMYNAFGKRLKIFMGDGGSLTLGYVAAFLCLKLVTLAQTTTPPVDDITPVTLMGLVFLPLYDMLRLFIARMWKGHSPFTPDKNHIHHKFLQLGYTHLQSTGMIMLVQACYIVGNFVAARWLNINLIFAIDFVTAMVLIGALERSIARKGRR